MSLPSETELLAALAILCIEEPYMGRAKMLQQLKADHEWALGDGRLKASMEKYGFAYDRSRDKPNNPFEGDKMTEFENSVEKAGLSFVQLDQLMISMKEKYKQQHPNSFADLELSTEDLQARREEKAGEEYRTYVEDMTTKIKPDGMSMYDFVEALNTAGNEMEAKDQPRAWPLMEQPENSRNLPVVPADITVGGLTTICMQLVSILGSDACSHLDKHDKNKNTEKKDSTSESMKGVRKPEDFGLEHKKAKVVITTCSTENVHKGVRDLRVTYSQGKAQLGFIYGQLINREEIKADKMQFGTVLDKIKHSDCPGLARKVFNQDGTFKETLTNNLAGDGESIWANQTISTADFTHIEKALVHLQHRRLGVGKYMVKQYLDEAERQGAKYAFTWPVEIHDDPGSSDHVKNKMADEADDIYFENQDIAVSFWRSMGFRRIGSTDWFGYAMDPTHPSRQLAAEDDYDPEDSA